MRFLSLAQRRFAARFPSLGLSLPGTPGEVLQGELFGVQAAGSSASADMPAAQGTGTTGALVAVGGAGASAAPVQGTSSFGPLVASGAAASGLVGVSGAGTPGGVSASGASTATAPVLPAQGVAEASGLSAIGAAAAAFTGVDAAGAAGATAASGAASGGLGFTQGSGTAASTQASTVVSAPLVPSEGTGAANPITATGAGSAPLGAAQSMGEAAGIGQAAAPQPEPLVFVTSYRPPVRVSATAGLGPVSGHGHAAHIKAKDHRSAATASLSPVFVSGLAFPIRAEGGQKAHEAPESEPKPLRVTGRAGLVSVEGSGTVTPFVPLGRSVVGLSPAGGFGSVPTIQATGEEDDLDTLALLLALAEAA